MESIVPLLEMDENRESLNHLGLLVKTTPYGTGTKSHLTGSTS